MCLCTGGCATTPTATTVVDEQVAGDGLLVQIEAVQPDQGGPFAHPISQSEGELASGIEGLLGELAYGRPKGQKLYELMPEAHRARLALGLAQGLRRAGPNERIAFLLRVDERSDVPWFTPTERLTRGVAFVDLEGRFHLAFDLIDDRVDPNDPEPYDPTQRAQTRARLVSETGEDVGASESGKRRLWVAWQQIPSPADAPRTAPQGPS